MRRLITLSVLFVSVRPQSEQEVLYGLPPLPEDPMPTMAPTTTVRPRLFRFGPILPVVPHPVTLPPLPPHIAHVVAHPVNDFYNINPIPELPPIPEGKLNGFYDLDGNFVPYGSEQQLAQEAARSRPKRAAKNREVRPALVGNGDDDYIYEDQLEPIRSTPAAPVKATTTRKQVSHDTAKVVKSTTSRRSHHVNQGSSRVAGTSKSKPAPFAKIYSRYLPQPPKPAVRPRPFLQNHTPPTPPQAPYQQQYQPPAPVYQQHQYPYYQPRQPYQLPAQRNQALPDTVQHAAPSQPQRPQVAENRDPETVGYLRDLEDYDWSFDGDRPDLNKLTRQDVQTSAPAESLVPFNGRAGQTLTATSASPYGPRALTPADGPGAPSADLAPPSKSLSRVPPTAGFTAPPDPLGLFSGQTPLLDLGRLFRGFGR